MKYQFLALLLVVVLGLSLTSAFAQETDDNETKDLKAIILEQMKVIQQLVDEIKTINEKLEILNMTKQSQDYMSDERPSEYTDPTMIQKKVDIYNEIETYKDEWISLTGQLGYDYEWSNLDFPTLETSLSMYSFERHLINTKDRISEMRHEVKERQEIEEQIKLEEKQFEELKKQEEELQKLNDEIYKYQKSLHDALGSYSGLSHPETNEHITPPQAYFDENTTHAERVADLKNHIQHYKDLHEIFDVPLP